jgi:acyl-coenzyme A synthetase/AMP-(fatty) acid ligase
MIDRYLDDQALTALTFRDGWFYPGDNGHMTADGSLVLEGRADDVMNLSGIKISPAELEAVAEAFPGVVECAALPIKSPVHGDIPVLAVATDGSVDLAALQQFCRARLGVRAPRKVFRVEQLPRNAAGKVAVPQLRELLKLND